MVSKCI